MIKKWILITGILAGFFMGPIFADESKPTLASSSRGPENAKVTIVEYLDFYCSYCRHSYATTQELLKLYPHDVRLVFRHYPLGITPGRGSYLAHEAAACATEQGKFWEFYDAVLPPPARFEKKDFMRMASEFKLNAKQFESCLDSHKYEEFLDSELRDGMRRGVSGTPAFFVNGHLLSGAYPVSHFKKIIDWILSGKEFNLEKINAVEFKDLDGKPSQGSPAAPAVIVEFSDFHCPYCKKVSPTLDQLMQKYPGAIHRVWRHFPLDMHQGAVKTHEASECAAEQGKFWEYHGAIFENQPRLRQEGILTEMASKVGLDMKVFGGCLESGKHRQKVESDIAKGREAGVKGTPAVFVNGRLIEGARPYEYFDQVIREAIDEKD